MEIPLLQTKLYIPPPHPNLVTRLRLIERLNQGGRRKLTLVSAPAGFGKTTLVSEWLRQIKDEDGTPLGQVRKDDVNQPNIHPSSFTQSVHPSRVAWLSLDEADNDTTRYLTYLIAALQQIDPQIGLAAGRLLQSSPPEAPETILTTLINELAAISDESILVLDDYHLIEAQPVHAAFTFLLDYLPPPMHLVITTRVDPPLPLSRLRVRQQMVEIREDDLRFTLDEVATFLNEVMGLDFSAKDIAALEARTEGWIAGLQLATLSLQGRDAQNKSDFIAAFTGSHRYIVDYLADEVLHQQPEPIQTFLLQTSILDRLCGPLCDAVLNKKVGQNFASSQEVLEYLEQANLFIVPLDHHRQWYRYHQLFANFLRTRLPQTFPAEVVELHRRASRWYAEHDLIPEAIHHALTAEEFELAADLIEQVARPTIAHGELMTMLNWLNALPDDVVRQRPRLSFAHAWALCNNGQFETAEVRLQEVEAAYAAGILSDEGLLGGVTAIRAIIAYAQEGLDRAIALSHQALNSLPPDDTHFRGPIAVHLAMAYKWHGDIEAARQAYTQAKISGEATDRLVTTLLALAGLADLEVAQGRLHQAAELYQQALDFAAEQGGQHSVRLPIAGIAHVGLGELLYEWNNLAGASHHLLTGLELGEQFGSLMFSVEGYANLAYLKLAQADRQGAVEALAQAERLAKKFSTPRTSALITACRVRLWLTPVGSDLVAAGRWVQAYQLDEVLDYSREPEYLALARILIALQQPGMASAIDAPLDRATDLLARLQQAAETTGRTGDVIKMLILQALILETQGQADQALTRLEQALTLAEPSGYIRTFVDEGPPMAELLKRLSPPGAGDESGRMKEYIKKLLVAFDGVDIHPSAPVPVELSPQPLVEPLSERELEVLRLIAEGASNREIAETLVLAIGTVKKHISNIFGKLNVTSRTQAVARARELDLLQ